MISNKSNLFLPLFVDGAEQQLEKARSDRLEAIQELERVNKRKLADAETKMQ